MKLWESLDICSRHRIQILKEAASKGHQTQFTKGWSVTEEVLGSLQLFLIATYPAIYRLGSVPDSLRKDDIQNSGVTYGALFPLDLWHFALHTA